MKLLVQLEKDNVFPAHIRLEETGAVIQTVREHCLETAQYAKGRLSGIGLSRTAFLAGLLHDAGKLTNAYRGYLVDAVEGRPVQRGTVNHTFAGVRLTLDRLCGERADPMLQVAAQHIAYAVGAHHGLFDCIDEKGESGFDWRRSKEDPNIEEGVARFLKGSDPEKLRGLLADAGREIRRIYLRLPLSPERASERASERAFYAHLISRLLLSAVIEGDRKSTAEFSCPGKPESPVRASPQMWEGCLQNLETMLARFPKETTVQRGRAVFSDRCRAFAEKPAGIYRMNMPTGAGKTLSSLRYALAHGKRWGKDRVIFVMPLLAIIDQNAEVIRRAIGRDELILEHHSNVLPCEDTQEMDYRELLMENWDAPVVITTLVQLLNTMFSHRTSSIRRFHSLCNSVIVIDEVQTVPSKLLSLFNQTITFLSEICRATIILCSATQPALEFAQRPLGRVPEEMIPYDELLWESFRRTVIRPTEDMTLAQIGQFASGLLEEKDSILIVCNKKSQAAELYSRMQGVNATCFHLSASMCMAHRRQTLAQMEAAKQCGKVLCISTQVVEAGVDISFACVIRLMAGMDSVVQAAGRCNRSGESDIPGAVYVIRCIAETLTKLKEIQAGKQATMELFDTQMEDYGAAEAIARYYRCFYREQKGKYQDFYCEEVRTTLYDLLSDNRAFRRATSPSQFLNQAYKTAGMHFQVFDEDTVDVVVPYGAGAEEIGKLDSDRARQDPGYLAERLRALKPYAISLYAYQRQALEKQGALTVTTGGVRVLNADWYDDGLGLMSRRQELSFLEV